MNGQHSFYPGFGRDLSIWFMSAMLASCSQQRGEASHMQFNFSPQSIGSSLDDSVFDSPSSISR